MGALVPTANGKRKEGPGKVGREHDVAQTWNFPAGWKIQPPSAAGPPGKEVVQSGVPGDTCLFGRGEGSSDPAAIAVIGSG